MATEATPTATGTEVLPNMTIYINNLNEKIKLDGTHLNIIISFSSIIIASVTNN